MKIAANNIKCIIYAIIASVFGALIYSNMYYNYKYNTEKDKCLKYKVKCNSYKEYMDATESFISELEEKGVLEGYIGSEKGWNYVTTINKFYGETVRTTCHRNWGAEYNTFYK